jgi:hypothetical protein
MTDGCIWQQTEKSVGQVLVPVPAHHTFEIDSWPPITGSRALIDPVEQR